MNRRLLTILLACLFTIGTLLVFTSFCLLLGKLRAVMGWQINGYSAWILILYVLLGWRIRGKVWQLGLACAACNVLAYLAFRMHRENLRQAFDHLGDLMMIISFFTGRGWGRKIGQKLKSTALTAVNAASFKRQSAEVLSCRS